MTWKGISLKSYKISLAVRTTLIKAASNIMANDVINCYRLTEKILTEIDAALANSDMS